MDPGWNEKTVFLTALELAPSQRDDYLRRACPSDQARRRIEELLDHHLALTQELLDASRPPATPADHPERIEEFQILRRLGEGGMGVVYLAEDLLLGRRVALKVLAPHMVGSADAIARFRTEAQSAAAINHPAIVPVYRFGCDAGTHYIVSEYVEGPTLAEVIQTERGQRTGAVSTQARRAWYRRGAEILATVADALDAAHRKNIIHRDVKPANIILDRERGPRLTDFGIAKHLTEESRTVGTALVGTCHYMSPEQAAISQAAVDQRSDVFSLGVVLFEFLSLRRPFDGASHAAILKAVVEQAPPRLCRLDAAIPRDLEVICHKALEKHPTDRYQTAGHIAADLRCFFDDRPILAKPPSPARRMRFWARRNRVRVVLGLFVVMVATTILLFLAHRESRRQSLAWLALESEVPGLVAYAQRVIPDTLQLEEIPTRLGPLPIRNALLPPGQYRVTVAASPTRFLEFNVQLFEPGGDNAVMLQIRERSHPGDSRTPAANAGTTPHTLIGWLRPDQELDVTDMVLVPAGTYTCGSLSGESDPLLRIRDVRLAAFYIDRSEVSNAEYRQYLAATGRGESWIWKRFTYDPELDDRPVIGLTQEEMESYARWRGKRLPTVFEWQAAVRGPTGRQALGQIDSALSQAVPASDLHMLGSREPSVHWDLYRRHTASVHQHDSHTGTAELYHCFGNVREMTGSLAWPRREVVVMGRAWCDSPEFESLSSVWYYPRDASDFVHGFRCARSAEFPGLDSTH